MHGIAVRKIACYILDRVVLGSEDVVVMADRTLHFATAQSQWCPIGADQLSHQRPVYAVGQVQTPPMNSRL